MTKWLPSTISLVRHHCICTIVIRVLCAHACGWFCAESGSYERLNEREQADVRQLWIGKLTEQRKSLGSTVIEHRRQQQDQEQQQLAAVSRL